MRKSMISILLAGGQGSRLGVLTKHVAKPAVSYGGKYRIIDFPLSNCVNSGVDTVGVCTQYQPLKLNHHIGIGKPWDLDRLNGGVTVLSPYLRAEVGQWYLGTANAVCQNINYIDSYDPDYVLILSGDHIYKMDYSKMLDFHIKHEADATISVINVTMEEATRYGIMNTQPDGRIYEFEEKPAHPKSTLASMGIYIFSWKALKSYLLKDDADSTSEHDFGKNIIPNMLNDGRSMWAYEFQGYWKDVGTIQAYWESNMDLVKRKPDFDLFDPQWKIYTPNPVEPAHWIAPTGVVKTSVVAEGCIVKGTIRNSVIFPGVIVEEGAEIVDSIVMADTVVGKNCRINKSIIGEQAKLGDGVVMGAGDDTINKDKPKIYYSGITVVGDNACIPAGTTLGKNVMVDEDVTAADFASKNIASGESVYRKEIAG